MRYNVKYGRWFTKGGLVYRYNSKQDKLVLCKQSKTRKCYCECGGSNGKVFKVHRAIYETFIGEIPQGYEIDHINTIRDDNRIENLRAVTSKENSNNTLTRKHISEVHKGMVHTDEVKNKMSDSKKGKTYSEFGRKFKEHFGITYYENPKLYNKERGWYLYHNKTCRWEKE